MDEEMTKEGEQWIIIAVKYANKKRRRYELYAEQEEPLISVHEDILIRFRLAKGKLITADQLNEIRTADERHTAYTLAVAYLGPRPRTRKQIYEYLLRKELEHIHIEHALNRLKQENLIDDEQYARQFAAGRLKSSQKGRLWIQQELRQRGVSAAIAADALSIIDRESEIAAAKLAAEKKWRTLKGEKVERKHKLMGFMLRRGFPGEIVREAIKSMDLGDHDDAFNDDDGLLLDN